jgi:hypothetical protein
MMGSDVDELPFKFHFLILALIFIAVLAYINIYKVINFENPRIIK